MNNSYSSNSFNVLIIILFCLALVPLLFLCFYTEPAADDYTYAIKLSKDYFLHIQVYEYLHWGSRYTATAILIINPIHWGFFFGYKIIALCMILLFICASFFMFSQLIKNKKLSLYFTTFFCFTYFFLVPDTYSAFYWLAGSATYHLGNILFLLFIGCLIKWNKYNNIFLKIFIFFLAFLLIGCNEISMIYLDIFIFLSFIYNFYTKKTIYSIYFYLLIWAGILTLFILLAPGNSARSASIINPLSFYEIIIKTFRKTTVIILRYGVISFLITFLVFYNFKKHLINIKLKFLKLPFYFYIPLFLVLIALGCFPSLYTLGFYPPLRTVNVIFLIVLLFSMIFCYKLVTIPIIFNTQLPQYLLSITLLILVLGYTFVIGNKNISELTNNLYHSYNDLLRGKAEEYRNEVNERYMIIQNSKKDTIYLSPLQSRPKTISGSDLSPDYKHFYNESMAEFFNKKVIISK